MFFNLKMPDGAQRATPGGASAEAEAAAAEALKRIREFNLKPREIRDYLDRFVIQQAEAKKVLAVALCDHYHHVRQCLAKPALRELEYAKQNVLLLGPTGVGKTYLVRCLARLIGVPFVKADATKFSETGYVGRDVDDLVRDLVRQANGQVELAQYGIIYLDEVDKIASRAGAGSRDVSGRGVQTNLLKLMEETEVNLHSQTDIMGQIESAMTMMQGGKGGQRTVSTRHMLFIVSGAFDKLSEIVRRRLQGGQIGFGGAGSPLASDDAAWLRQVGTRDLVEYGYEPEFVGRLPVRVVCDPLTVSDFEQILRDSEGSILDQYRRDFQGYGIELKVTPEALSKVARLAHLEGTGARGLMTVFERVLRPFKFELPSTGVTELIVEAATVDDPPGALAQLLRANHGGQFQVLAAEVAAFAGRFAHEHGFTLEFTPEAVALLVQESLTGGKTMRALCEEKFRDYPYALDLIARGGGPRRFQISEEGVQAPGPTVTRWVREALARGHLGSPAAPASPTADSASPAANPAP